MSYLNESEYNFVFSKTPRICVDLFIRLEDGGCIVGERTHEPYLGYWALPGGRLRFGESVRYGIDRIARTELSLPLYDIAPKLLDYIEYPEEIKLAGVHSISMVFEVFAVGSPKPSEFFKNIKSSRHLDIGEKVIPQILHLLPN